MAIFNQDHLKKFQFKQLFITDLGWDVSAQQSPYSVEIGEETWQLHVVAHKRGVQFLHCQPNADGDLPDYAMRQKIERNITRDVREHLIVFTDTAKTTQIWQWVSRLSGKTAQYREVQFLQGETPELLTQKLERLRFTLDEEELLTVLGVAARLDDAAPREKVTKKFYAEFEKQRKAFAEFIEGIPVTSEDQRWYTAVLIDRLMFLWFLQEKSFLDGKKDYLQSRLAQHLDAQSGTSFYKNFLAPLFFRGFAEERTSANSAEIEASFGKVPYLNGGLFSPHELELTYGAALDVADVAFSKLFVFFNQWEWHLDERPLKSNNEINPDVLGYIFEKFVNQKQMGAYYTKEDITDYIGKNTIIPCLLNKVRAEHPRAFDALAWPLLQHSGDDYIYPAMKKGVDDAYPDEIINGLDTQVPGLLERRKPWNKRADDNLSLPTEIWRETIARHQRTREIRAKLAAGEIKEISDLITYNLDIRQFAQDLIERCSDVGLLKSFWFNLAGRLPRKSNETFRHGLSVLDPTCGSGAFLFAALNILKPLYDATLRTLQAVRNDVLIAGEKSHPEKWGEVDDLLARFATAGSDRAQDYAVIKHIIVNNLYGVDIEKQATEIAKLRLFLKLVALLEPGDQIEPLPDIDFNIRHGNTLVGYATENETEKAVKGATQGNLFSDAWDDIRLRLSAVEQQYNNFQIQQVQRGGHVSPADKQALVDTLHELEEMLNYHLAREYGVNTAKTADYEKWKISHQPFHWFVDFYPLMVKGGFDIAIGNPPYVVFPSKDVPYKWPRHYFSCESTKNLYALVAERSIELVSQCGLIGLIVQLTSLSSERMSSFQRIMAADAQVTILPFPRRPESIFEGVEMPTAIWIRNPSKVPSLVTTSVRRFYSMQRSLALVSTQFFVQPHIPQALRVPKIDRTLADSLLKKLSSSRVIDTISTKIGSHKVFYQEACRYWAKSSNFSPKFIRNGESIDQPHGRIITFDNALAAGLVNCLLNSSLFYWYYSTLADCEHVNDSLVRGFPLPLDWQTTDWTTLSNEIDAKLRSSAKPKSILTKQGHVVEYDEIDGKLARDVIVRADIAFSSHFDFSSEELDYVVNYDIKYRTGQNTENNDD
jgi:hypothetical protein